MKKRTELAQRRLAQGMTGVQMASRLGIAESRYYYIENGGRPATPEIAKRIAEELGTRVCELFDPKLYQVKGGKEND